MANYQRYFMNTTELNDFVRYMKEENNLNFEWDKSKLKAWINNIDDETEQELRQMEIEEGLGFDETEGF